MRSPRDTFEALAGGVAAGAHAAAPHDDEMRAAAATAPSSSPTCTWARPAARPTRCSTSSSTTRASTLYLVGDIVDGWQLRRRWYWPQAHNDVVQKLLRKARKGSRVVFVPGNHDEFARQFVGHALRRHRGGARTRCTSPPTAAGCG